MPFDSQGNFTRVMNWQEDAANSIPILASRHDDEDDNFANGFNETMCRDGRTAMTGQLKMNNNKIVNVANATASGDAVNKGQLDSVQTTLQTNINAKANDNNVVKLTGNQTIAGTKTFSSSPVLPTPSSSDNSTKGATTAFVKSVLSSSGNGLATYSKSADGYYKFDNGLIIQWGQTASGSSTTVTLPTAFTSTNYVVSVGFETSSGENYAAGYDSKTITGFKIHTSGGAASRSKSWIAIGY